MHDIAPTVRRWRTADHAVALASVVSTLRSSPRPVGTTLAVSRSGAVIGSVSGGCVEADVCRVAGEVLDTGIPRLVRYGIGDDEALDVGLPCGGEIEVFVSVPDPADLDRRLALGPLDRAVVLTVLEGPDAGATLLVPVDPPGPPTGDAPPSLAVHVPAVLAAGRSLVVEADGHRVLATPLGASRRLIVVGAYDIAEELCTLATRLGWRTTVIDARERFATRERLPSAHEIVVAWPEEAISRVAPDGGSAVVVLSHDPKFDVPALRAALASPAFYVGALGSRANQRARRPRLLAAGVPEAQLGRIHGPCGLDLGGGSPVETALSILAEIVAAANARSGSPLSGEHGPPIHPR